MDRSVFQEQFGLLGESPAIRHVIDKIVQVAAADITVLIQGESGVGKDVTARAIHALSARRKKEIVIVNCGAIPEGIIESELFGHEKGSFTGAHEAREGFFEKADGGTIFLDEIGDTPKNVQVKLLRVLESGEFSRVGSSKLSKTDVRVIAATNRDLWQMVREGSFREDLYYRLDTVNIVLPPLRERHEDILPLFRKFAKDFAAKYDSVFKGITDDAVELLQSYRWPGNIRELRNVAEQLVVLEKSQIIDKQRLQKYLKGRQQSGSTDHLPIVTARPSTAETPGYGHHRGGGPIHDQGPLDTRLIYKAMLEMKEEISDLKRMLANLIYTQFSAPSVRALPPGLNRTVDPKDISPYISNRGPLSDDGFDSFRIHPGPTGPSAGRPIPFEPSGEPIYGSPMVFGSHRRGEPMPLSEEASIIDPVAMPAEDPSRGNGHPMARLLDVEEIPTMEQMERYLIDQALKRFDGNRRKASEVLGISERTLYRKIDQFGLE